MNLPNFLTLLRVLLIPVLVLVWFIPMQYSGEIAAVIFIGAALTDWLDGWLARRWEQESAFGAFLDPVADKLMVAAALVLLVDAFNSSLVTLSAIVIIGRLLTFNLKHQLMLLLELIQANLVFPLMEPMQRLTYLLMLI